MSLILKLILSLNKDEFTNSVSNLLKSFNHPIAYCQVLYKCLPNIELILLYFNNSTRNLGWQERLRVGTEVNRLKFRFKAFNSGRY